MAPVNESTRNAESPKARVARLRQEVDALTIDRVSPVVSDAAAKAQRTVTDATAVMRDRTRVVAEQMKQRPFVSVAIGVALGYLLSRVIRR